MCQFVELIAWGCCTWVNLLIQSALHHLLGTLTRLSRLSPSPNYITSSSLTCLTSLIFHYYDYIIIFHWLICSISTIYSEKDTRLSQLTDRRTCRSTLPLHIFCDSSSLACHYCALRGYPTKWARCMHEILTPSRDHFPKYIRQILILISGICIR